MSYLREIMQRLNARTVSGSAEGATPVPPLAGVHVEHYREQLDRCSPPMLQYEWAWLEQHEEDLQLCASRPDMVAAAGGAARVRTLQEESRRFRDLLERRMKERGLGPAHHRAAVVANEHAWEVTHPGLRQQWGLDSGPADGSS